MLCRQPKLLECADHQQQELMSVPVAKLEQQQGSPVQMSGNSWIQKVAKLEQQQGSQDQMSGNSWIQKVASMEQQQPCKQQQH
jgi:hypothetical protein